MQPTLGFDVLRESWVRSLSARQLAANTVHIYNRSAVLLCTYLAEHHPKVGPGTVAREHVEEFLVAYGKDRSPATLSQVFRSLQQWFGWLLDEGEIDANPMARMPPPLVPEKPVPVLSEEQLRALLEVCEGRRLVDRRDMAIIRLMIDSGGRLSEIAGLRVTDVDLDEKVCTVMGKGRRERVLPFGDKTTLALDRYLRSRALDRRSKDAGLWLGERGKGALSGNGIYQMLRRRGEAAGLPNIHPHQFRHTAAHRWLAEGGNEGDLMQLNGWKSRSMLTRYAASAAAERARAAHKKMALGDRL